MQEGQAIWLVGPNGCGKTSLLNIINGFYTANSWIVKFYDENITTLKVQQRANRGIGRVFQSFGIFKNLTLFENLALAYTTRLDRRHKLLPIRFLPKQFKHQINTILEEVQLYHKKNELAGNLSWGQMRLLEIARLYLQDTKLFLLDEPTAGVSPKLKSKVIELLNKIIAMWKMVIIVEHDFKFLWEFVDRLLVMEDGKLILDGSYKEIKDDPLLKEVYFG